MVSASRARSAPALPETLELTIERLLPNGDGLAWWSELPLYVRFVAPSELVRVRPFWAKAKRGSQPHLRGELLEVVQASPDRVAAPCGYFGQCGGCQYQHLDYAAQLDLKRRQLAETLAATPGLVAPDPRPVIGCPEPYGYRNQLRLSLDRQGQLCFTYAGRRKTFPVDHCHLAAPAINALLADLQGSYQGRHQVAIRVGYQTGETLIYPPSGAEAGGSSSYFLTERILGETFRINHSSFFQVNTRPFQRVVPAELAGLGWPAEGTYSQADILALLVLRSLDLAGSRKVVDTYAGVGVFARLLAQQGHEVLAIEESAPAVADARHNLAGLDGVTIVQAKTEEALPGVAGSLDAVVLDPARPGCAPAVIEALLEHPVSRLVYVSCEPETLARDLTRLADRYQIDWIQPLDMFPQTRHLETVVRLSPGEPG